MSVKLPLTFHIFQGDTLVRSETITQPVIKIGKLSSSHLRIEDEAVSRMHAVIEVSGPGDITIIDLGSTRGTLVNDQKVNKAKLQDGDTILLGDTRIQLEVGQPVQDSAPIPAAPRGPSAALSSPPVAPPQMSAPRSSVSQGAPHPQAAMAAPQFGFDSAQEIPGQRAIEVAAMLGDSVVAVKHLTNPKGGKVTRPTYAMFAGAAAAMLVAVIVFGFGVHVASLNEESFKQWVDVDRKAAIDFRPKRLHPAMDALAMLGMGAGFALITLALSRMIEEKRSPYFRIGQGLDVEFPTSDSPVEAFPLVGPMGDDFAFSWTQGMRGEMSVQSQGQTKTTPLDQLPPTGPIPLGARIRTQLGSTTFMISSVPAPKRETGAFLASIEGIVFAFFAGSAVVHLGFLGLIFSIPPDSKSLALDLLGNNERLVKVQLKPPEEPKQVEDMTNKGKEDEKSGGTGTKQAGDEGKMGKKDSTRASGQYAMKNNSADPQLAKMQAMDQARNSGILGALRSQQGGAFASLTGTGDFSSGIDDRDVYGGLIGNEVGEMQGGYGYGLSGTGAGGGGTGLGTIGTGRYGTIGHGSGTGSGYGIGSGKGGMHGRRAGTPHVNIGNATATGDLDKNIIRRYIRQRLPQFQHCYEKELVVKTTLAGTVTTQFTISGNGQVISARASGIGDTNVENCVAEVVRSIQFPKPTGGGLVNVTYPFIFQSHGE